MCDLRRLSLSSKLCSFWSFYPSMSMEQDKDYCHHEDALLRDDLELTKAAKNTKKTQNSSDSISTMTANMNHTMAVMVGNISSMGNALKRIHADTDHGGDGRKHFLNGKCTEENAC